MRSFQLAVSGEQHSQTQNPPFQAGLWVFKREVNRQQQHFPDK